MSATQVFTGSADRRQFLRWIGAGSLALTAGSQVAGAAAPLEPRRIAAVITTYFRNSHADVLVGKILNGWRQDGGPGPNLKLVSMFTDQVHRKDLSRELADRHGFRITETIDEALTFGTDELQVDGVLSIGEHGNYELNDIGQRKYPRRRFFDGIVAAMKRCDTYVPVFSDKHLSWNWDDAKHMYDTAADLGIPFMAGSSLPVAWRYPATQLPRNTELEEALVVGYGGLESYGFHALESLQCLVERRAGGEQGVAAVTAVQGDQIWQAEKEGKWNRQLVQTALKTFNKNADRLEERLNAQRAAFYLIEYRDGFRATVAMLNGVIGEVAAAYRVKGSDSPQACWFRLEQDFPYGHFEHLLRAIEHMYQTGKPAYPVDRTLLTTGVLEQVMKSLSQDGRRLVTPHLNVAYQPSNWTFANERADNFPG